MGTVHGVYLKYVALSAFSYVGLIYLFDSATNHQAARSLSSEPSVTLWRVIAVLILLYSAVLNAMVAFLFKIEKGMKLVGKNEKTGQIPFWSFVLYFPFHLPSQLYTYVHTSFGTQRVEKDGKTRSEKVPVASEVQAGWWVGGCYSHRLNKDWAAVIDLTVEFSETTIHRTASYLAMPTWDGVPASPEQLEWAASLAVAARRHGGDVLIHCAHGRGRSTTVMCACLVKAGLFRTWQEAFEKGIKPQRSVCKLNQRMRQVLTEWQERYADGKDNKQQ